MKLSQKFFAAVFCLLSLASLTKLCAQTQSDMTREACDAYRKADGELNRLYQQVLTKYKDNALFVSAFRNEQRAWLSMRDALLQTDFPLGKGETGNVKYGSVYPMCRCLNLEKTTLERVERLRRMMVETEMADGDVCAGEVAQTGQTQIIQFSEMRARVSAVETLNAPLRLVFSTVSTGRELFAFDYKDEAKEFYKPEDFNSLINAFLRFRTVSVEDLPSPLVLGVAVNPGGSDHGFMTHVFGEDGGVFKRLTPESLHTAIAGGVHLGDLGAERGKGVALWNSVWADDEAHTAPHRYEVRLYPYDAASRTFVKGETLVTKNKHAGDRAALDELKLSFFINQLDLVSGIEEYRTR